MSDYIVRAISTDGLVQAAAICSRGITERARQIHHTSPVATAALGRALAGASMMGNALKGQGASLTLHLAFKILGQKRILSCHSMAGI